jgi:hypothetical protein
MKTNLIIALFLVFVAALIFPANAMAKGLSDGRVVFGGSFTLSEGEILDGDLVVFGGVATIETSATVNGNIALMGGTLETQGKINGDVVALGGLVELSNTAFVTGDVIVIGAHLEQAENSTIGGDIVSTASAPMMMKFPGGFEVPRIDFGFSPIVDMVWFFFRVFIWAAIAVLLAMFLPNHTERIGRTAIRQPFLAGSLGLLTLLVGSFGLLLLAITLIFLPVSILGALSLALAWVWGILAIGLEIGKRLGLLIKQEWPTAVSAGVGTFLLVLVMNGANQAVPCIGWMLPALVVLVGIGAVVLTRIGTQEYPLSEKLETALRSQNGSDVLPDSSNEDTESIDQD